MDYRAVQDLEPSRSRRFPDDDLGDVVRLGEADDLVRDAAVAARNGDPFSAERLGQPQRVRDAVPLLLAPLQAAPGLDAQRREGSMQPVRQALGVAHEAGGARILADADQNALARRPGPWNGVGLHVREQLLVDPLGGAPQRELAQRGQVAGREVVLERALGLFGNVDLAFLEPLDQVVRGKVDELDGVGAVEHRIRYGLAHAYVGDLRDDVVEALDVLDIDRGVDVDAAIEQLFDVEIALGMTTAGRVGMGKLVDQGDLGPPGNHGVEVHLLEPLIFVLETPAGNDLEPVEQGLRLLAAMGFDDADHDIVAVLLPGAGLLQHLVGLADAGGGTDENLEPAGAALFAPGSLEQGVRRGSLVRVAPLIRHLDPLFSVRRR